MKKYFITDELNETSKLIGPFNTHVEREFKKIVDKSKKF